MRKGFFITFEGPDGSGKTTVSKTICRRLEDQGLPVLYTREPGGIRIAEKIRSIILDPENKEMDDRTEALLYAASRRQNVVEKIRPALALGKIVISDRYVDSSLAYQGIGREIGVEEVYKINLFAIEDTLPDVTYFLNVDAETGLKRVQSSREEQDRLEQEALSFHQRVHEGYQQVYERFKDRMVSIDGNRRIDVVVEEIYRDILSRVSHD